MSRFNKLPGIDTENNTTRRNVLVGGGYGILGLGVLGAIAPEPDDDDAEPTQTAGNGNGDDGGTGDDTDPGDDTGSEAESDEPDYGDIETFSFSGSGDSVETGIELEEGLTVVDATHEGSSNFIVTLVGDDRDHLFVNEIGSYEGETAESLDSGEYTLDVDADGDWEIEIRMPDASRGYDLPVDESGTGPTVIGPYEFDGSNVLEAEHDGESNFVVRIMPPWGNPELVVNEIGSYEGASTTRFDGAGYVAIEADGSWSVEIE